MLFLDVISGEWGQARFGPGAIGESGNRRKACHWAPPMLPFFGLLRCSPWAVHLGLDTPAWVVEPSERWCATTAMVSVPSSCRLNEKTRHERISNGLSLWRILPVTGGRFAVRLVG